MHIYVIPVDNVFRLIKGQVITISIALQIIIEILTMKLWDIPNHFWKANEEGRMPGMSITTEWVSIKNCFLVKLRHVTGKCFFIWNRMLCSILWIKKQVKMSIFVTMRVIFAVAFFFWLQILLKMGTLVRTKNLYSHFFGKTKAFI